MIKKLIGIVVVVVVVVIAIIAAVRRDNFRSMVLRDKIMDQTYPQGTDAATPAIVPPDALPGSSSPVDEVVVETDSTTVVVTDSLP